MSRTTARSARQTSLRTNRVCVALVAMAVIGVGAAPSSAEKPVPPRELAVPYEVGAGIDCQRSLGCVMLVPKKGEQYLTFMVQDATGLPVYGTVTEKRRSSFQVFGEGEEFCGKGWHDTTSGKPVYLYFENHLGSWHRCPGGASRGVVQASFFRS